MFLKAREVGIHSCRFPISLLIFSSLISCVTSPATITETTITETAIAETILTDSTIIDKTTGIGDGGFLSGEPCGPPCFLGIIPGYSTEIQVVEILRENGLFCTSYDTEERGGSRGIHCPFGLNIGFKPDSDIVRGLGFRPSNEITIEEVISKIGEPDGLLVYPGGIPEAPEITIQILYINISTRLSLPSEKWPGYLLEPSALITNIAYSIDYDVSIKSNSFYQEWKGYGEY